MITLELPFPPSVNTYWRNTVVRGKPRTLLSKRGRQYRINVFDRLIATHGVEAYRNPIKGDLQCTIDLHPPDNRGRDCDNFAKAVLDALEHAGVYDNDKQIKVLTIRMHPKKPPGHVVVTLEGNP